MLSGWKGELILYRIKKWKTVKEGLHRGMRPISSHFRFSGF